MQETETDTGMTKQKKGAMERIWGSPRITENKGENGQQPAALEGGTTRNEFQNKATIFNLCHLAQESISTGKRECLSGSDWITCCPLGWERTEMIIPPDYIQKEIGRGGG